MGHKGIWCVNFGVPFLAIWLQRGIEPKGALIMPFLCPQSCNAFPLPTREGEGVSPSDYVYLLCVCWVLSHKLPFNISTILLLGRSIHFNVVALSQFLLREKKKTKGRSSREIRVKEVLEGHFHLESVKLMSFEMKLTYLCLSVLFYG